MIFTASDAFYTSMAYKLDLVDHYTPNSMQCAQQMSVYRHFEY